MTREEVLKIILVIKNTYPKTYEKFTKSDFEGMADMWQLVFEDYTYAQISVGLKVYLTTNTSGFPPVPAQLIAQATQNNPASELTSNEAWSLVYKAICNSTYNSEKEFEKLPDLCKKAIGSAESLKELARMDIDKVQSVEGSHFKRNYEALVKRQTEYNRIPQKTREQLEMLQSRLLLEVD